MTIQVFQTNACLVYICWNIQYIMSLPFWWIPRTSDRTKMWQIVFILPIWSYYYDTTGWLWHFWNHNNHILQALCRNTTLTWKHIHCCTSYTWKLHCLKRKSNQYRLSCTNAESRNDVQMWKDGVICVSVLDKFVLNIELYINSFHKKE